MTRYTGLLHAGACACALGLATMSTPPVAAQGSADVQRAVDAAYAKFKDLREGKNADYIPALAACASVLSLSCHE